MPHITEGDLHAYLDGALPAIDPDAEERLTAHLARCADCRARLERERDIHDRSGALLSTALPETAEIPPFESIRGNAVRGAGTGAAGGSRRLAWAASVVVALGAGWIGHALLGGSGESIPNAGLASEAVRPVSPSVGARTAADDADTSGDRAGAAANEASGRAETGPPAPREVAASPESVPPEDVRQERVGALAEDVPAAQEAAERERVEDAAPPTVGEPVALEETTVAAVPYTVDVRRDVEARSKAFAGAMWRTVALETAAEWMGRPLLAVSQLEVVDITVTEVDGLRLARVRQSLPDGAPLELVLERSVSAFADRAPVEAPRSEPGPDVLRSSGAVSADETGAAFWRRVGLAPPEGSGTPIVGVRATIDGVWVTLAAPVASDSLRAIVSRVHRLENP